MNREKVLEALRKKGVHVHPEAPLDVLQDHMRVHKIDREEIEAVEKPPVEPEKEEVPEKAPEKKPKKPKKKPTKKKAKKK